MGRESSGAEGVAHRRFDCTTKETPEVNLGVIESGLTSEIFFGIKFII